MKNTIDAYVEKYGDQNVPPPSQFFTVDNEVGRGNMHIVQQVFEGPFEFDILYSSRASPQPITCMSLSNTLSVVRS
jgi:mannosyl-oligosaccharide glucosidase